MKGIKLTSEVKYQVEILAIDKPIPKDQKKEFLKWSSTLYVYGLGRGFEYFSYDENSSKDIAVDFGVEIISSKLLSGSKIE